MHVLLCNNRICNLFVSHNILYIDVACSKVIHFCCCNHRCRNSFPKEKIILEKKMPTHTQTEFRSTNRLGRTKNLNTQLFLLGVDSFMKRRRGWSPSLRKTGNGKGKNIPCKLGKLAKRLETRLHVQSQCKQSDFPIC